LSTSKNFNKSKKIFKCIIKQKNVNLLLPIGTRKFDVFAALIALSLRLLLIDINKSPECCPPKSESSAAAVVNRPSIWMTSAPNQRDGVVDGGPGQLLARAQSASAEFANQLARNGKIFAY
jgi:hypothetical protein